MKPKIIKIKLMGQNNNLIVDDRSLLIKDFIVKQIYKNIYIKFLINIVERRKI